VALVVVCCGLVACSGGDGDTDSTVASQPVSTGFDTSTAVSERSTTTVAATTSTSTSTTEPAPTTTVDPVRAEIEAAYEVLYQGYWACLRSPDGCDTSYLVADGPSAQGLASTLSDMRDRDLRVGDDPVGYYVIEEITIGADATTADVVACWWSTAVLYGPPADITRPEGPDNPPTIVNNTPGSARQRDTFKLDGGIWRLHASDGLEDEAEVNLCAAG
jgi:hypothetical protein